MRVSDLGPSGRLVHKYYKTVVPELKKVYQQFIEWSNPNAQGDNVLNDAYRRQARTLLEKFHHGIPFGLIAGVVHQPDHIVNQIRQVSKPLREIENLLVAKEPVPELDDLFRQALVAAGQMTATMQAEYTKNNIKDRAAPSSKPPSDRDKPKPPSTPGGKLVYKHYPALLKDLEAIQKQIRGWSPPNEQGDRILDSAYQRQAKNLVERYYVGIPFGLISGQVQSPPHIRGGLDQLGKDLRDMITMLDSDEPVVYFADFEPKFALDSLFSLAIHQAGQLVKKIGAQYGIRSMKNRFGISPYSPKPPLEGDPKRDPEMTRTATIARDKVLKLAEVVESSYQEAKRLRDSLLKLGLEREGSSGAIFLLEQNMKRLQMIAMALNSAGQAAFYELDVPKPVVIRAIRRANKSIYNWALKGFEHGYKDGWSSLRDGTLSFEDAKSNILHNVNLYITDRMLPLIKDIQAGRPPFSSTMDKYNPPLLTQALTLYGTSPLLSTVPKPILNCFVTAGRIWAEAVNAYRQEDNNEFVRLGNRAIDEAKKGLRQLKTTNA